MNLNPNKGLRFHPPKGTAWPGLKKDEPFICPTPCIAQIRAVIELDPADDEARAKEAAGKRLLRLIEQTTILLAPPEPERAKPAERAEWSRARDAARGFVGQLDYRALVQVFNALWAASQGIDLDELERRVRENAEKKTTRPGRKSSPSSTST